MMLLRDILSAVKAARAEAKRVSSFSERYKKGLASYGRKVRSDKRKARIIAELNAMGVKPRVRRPMGRRVTVLKRKTFSFFEHSRKGAY